MPLSPGLGSERERERSTTASTPAPVTLADSNPRSVAALRPTREASKSTSKVSTPKNSLSLDRAPRSLTSTPKKAERSSPNPKEAKSTFPDTSISALDASKPKFSIAKVCPVSITRSKRMRLEPGSSPPEKRIPDGPIASRPNSGSITSRAPNAPRSRVPKFVRPSKIESFRLRTPVNPDRNRLAP